MLRKPLALFAIALLPLTGCSTAPPSGIDPVRGFQLERYQGRWYEIARLDHRFERGLQAVSADYSRNADGSIRVVNRGYDAAAASWRQAVGKAWFNGPADVASLKVSFFGPFYGGYHVAALDPATAGRWWWGRTRTICGCCRATSSPRRRQAGVAGGNRQAGRAGRQADLGEAGPWRQLGGSIRKNCC
ncbi:Outer membrane lipoprotein blc precursor [Chromobacterium violaceum]|uniref:Outer membrane lipoprotein blc n=1 Tax=Chromobacterium violaceum TaxID=536 RepID=A0A3S4LK72_CHRVL|nr:Outer membrane lipoprotein blc precursor [Chromobacterium violaceum]